MAKKKASKAAKRPRGSQQEVEIGAGGELHQGTADGTLTTNQGVSIADNQNTLTVGPRGPQLLEDFVLREKITHFDHERIPERVVHARGTGAHGHFEAYAGNEDLCCAAFLKAKTKTEVFCRFSTVAGSKGSSDTVRDARGFAVKFYTSEGNYDLVGNNIPVFFIQDAMKFPDLIHAVKAEPDRGFPQAASAHDTFWDFVSLSPESMHMLMWVMSDRGIPRSYRMMDGFGVHTFRMINAKGVASFVKFHWRPMLGASALVWDEAVKISGADADFHRRDLWSAIERGDFPAWELSVQAFSEEEAATFSFDVLDPTKLIPEEVIPLRPLGRMVLDRNVSNFFAETEQVAFCPSHLVPGIDFSNDPLLQGRLFSYLDTQLSRLGGPNFHQIPINRPRSPMANFQRDAAMQMETPEGRAAYEPNSLDGGTVRESRARGFRSYAAHEAGDKQRIRPESFRDHYTQARQFWNSMTSIEQQHIASAFAFELAKCQRLEVRERMLGHLRWIAEPLMESVAKKLGFHGQPKAIQPALKPGDPLPSPALSLHANAKQSLRGRVIGVFVSAGFSSTLHTALAKAIAADGGRIEVVCDHAGMVAGDNKTEISVDHTLEGAPSVLFDAVVLAPGSDQEALDAAWPQLQSWLRDAFLHMKAIGYTEAATSLVEDALPADAATNDEAVISMKKSTIRQFITAAEKVRNWHREERLLRGKAT